MFIVSNIRPTLKFHITATRKFCKLNRCIHHRNILFFSSSQTSQKSTIYPLNKRLTHGHGGRGTRERAGSSLQRRTPREKERKKRGQLSAVVGHLGFYIWAWGKRILGQVASRTAVALAAGRRLCNCASSRQLNSPL